MNERDHWEILDEELAAREKETRNFQGLSHADALGLEIPETVEIVEDMIEAGTLGTIAGLPETHKSFAAVSTACKVAAGEGLVLGRFPVRTRGRVGYWWQDDSKANELRRLQDYSRRHGYPDLPIRWHLNEGLRLPDDLPALREEVEREGQVLVVLDSLYNFLPGLSLKDEDVAIVLAAVKSEVCDETGTCVCYIDHAPWPNEGNRRQRRGYGSVFKAAVQRWGIYLERDGSKLWVEARGNNVRGLKRTLALWNEEELELHLVDTSAQEEDEEELDRRVLEFVREHPGGPQTRVREGVPGRNESIDSSLSRLKMRGEVCDLARGGGAWSGRPGTPRYWYPADLAALTSPQLFGAGSGEEDAQAPQEGNLARSPHARRGGEVARGADEEALEDEVSRLLAAARLGDEMFPAKLANAVSDGHILQWEAEERLALHRFVTEDE